MGAIGIATAGRWRWRRSFSGFYPKISINYLTINILTIDNLTIKHFAINHLAIYHCAVNRLTITRFAITRFAINRFAINRCAVSHLTIDNLAITTHCTSRSDPARNVMVVVAVVVGKHSACSYLSNHALLQAKDPGSQSFARKNRIPPSFPKQSIHRLRFRGRARINLGTPGINSDNFQAFIIAIWQSPWLDYL